jgi:NADH dehydrogenase FAD-containing subunit
MNILKKKVVVIGGGFAGSYCAKKLENDFDVTLIDTKNYFEFTPSILRVIVHPENLDKIQIRHFDYLKKSEIVLGKVRRIDRKKVFVGNTGFDYDYLVIASGSSYKSPFKSEKIILPKRGEELKDCHKNLKKAKEILIVGGGLVGVELAGEIVERYPRKKLTLIHSNKNLIPRNHSNSMKICKEFLEKKGVKIIFEKMFKEGSKKRYDMIFYCTGISPNSGFIKSVEVDDFLKVKGRKNVFIAGDVSGFNEEKTAQNAVEHAKVVVKNIKRLEENEGLKKYSSRKRPFIISLGSRRGILEYGNFVWFGRIPALLKNFVERRHMRKLRIRKH